MPGPSVNKAILLQNLRQPWLNNMTSHIGQSKISALMTMCQFQVIEPKQMQQRSLRLGPRDSLPEEFVRIPLPRQSTYSQTVLAVLDRE